jgi:hypothetical protein
MMRTFPVLLLMLVPLAGCNVLSDLLNAQSNQNLAYYINREMKAKDILGGNSERAVLVNIQSYFGFKDFGEPVVLDLATGSRTPTGVELARISTVYSRYGVAETDGDYLAWDGDSIEILDLRGGQRRTLWENGEFDGLSIRSWVLSEGRIIASAYNESESASSHGPVTNIVHTLANGQTRHTPPLDLGRDIVGDAIISFRQEVTYELLDGYQIAVPTQTLISETNLESGDVRELASLPARGSVQKLFATTTHIVWDEADYDNGRAYIAFLNRISGEISYKRFSSDVLNMVALESAGDGGAVVFASAFVPLAPVTSRYEFINWNGESVVLQAFTSYRLPITGAAAFLGDRIVWTDFDDGRLRYYVVSTGEHGEY